MTAPRLRMMEHYFVLREYAERVLRGAFLNEWEDADRRLRIEEYFFIGQTYDHASFALMVKKLFCHMW